MDILRWNSRYARVNELLELTLESLTAGHCTRSQRFSMSSWILWLQCLVSSVPHVPWLKIKQSLRSGVCRTIRPLTPQVKHKLKHRHHASARRLPSGNRAPRTGEFLLHTLVIVKVSNINTQQISTPSPGHYYRIYDKLVISLQFWGLVMGTVQ